MLLLRFNRKMELTEEKNRQAYQPSGPKFRFDIEVLIFLLIKSH